MARPEDGHRRNEAWPSGVRPLSVATAVMVLVLLPTTMAIANKSAPLVLGLAAALANAAALAAGRAEDLGRRYRLVALGGTGRLLAALVLAAVVSLAWTIDPAMTYRGLIEASPELAFGWALAAAWPIVGTARDLRWLKVGVILAAGLIAFEASTGMPLHHLVGARAEDYDLKRSAVPIVLLAWPAVAFSMARKEDTWAAGLAIAAGIAAVFAHSGASVLAVVGSATIYAAARIAPRAAHSAVMAALCGLVIATPWAGTLADRFLPPDARVILSEQHASHRIAIWTAFEEHIRDRALAGHGFNTSFRIAGQVEGHDTRADGLVIENIHPHNVLLQAWVEFGLLGGVGVGAALVFIGARIRRLPASAAATRLGFLCSAGAVSLVGLNAWSPWWLAVVAACLMCFRMLRDDGAVSDLA